MLLTFTLSSVVRSEKRSLAAIVLNILKISKDSIKKAIVYISSKILFCLHCSLKIGCKITLGEFKIDQKYIVK